MVRKLISFDDKSNVDEYLELIKIDENSHQLFLGRS